jgi:uncharacterized protein (TIGR03067 family)
MRRENLPLISSIQGSNMSNVAASHHESSTAHDLAALQGSWVQIAFEENGSPDTPDTHGAPGAITTFESHHFTVRTLEGKLLLEGDFTLDATTSPKSITWIDAMGVDKGKRLPASYKLEGDRFTFIAADEGMPRPLVFSTQMGQTMRSFVRRGH